MNWVSESTRIDYFLGWVDQLSAWLHLNEPQIIYIDRLRLLPVGSLGRDLADLLDQQQLTPFTTGFRRKQLHDPVHVLTGYGTDRIGEAEVQAFLLGTRFRVTHLLLGLGLLGAQIGAVNWADAGPRLWQAYLRGQNSSFDLDLWQPETEWHLPLVELRDRFQL